MKASIIIRNLLLSSVLFLALSAASLPSRRQLPDESSVSVVGTVLRGAPFMYTEMRNLFLAEPSDARVHPAMATR